MKKAAAALGLGLGAVLVLVLTPGVAPADGVDAGSAADAGDMGVEAGAGDAGALDAGREKPPVKKVLFIDIPEEDRKTGKTKPPAVAEWKKAEPIALAHGGRYCSVYRVREWLKVACTTDVSVLAEVVAGNSDDIYFFMREPECTILDLGIEGYQAEQICSDLVDMVFPVHEGDRRAIQLAALRGGYGMGSTSPFRGTHLISVVWLPQEPGPVVTIGQTSGIGF